MGWKSVKDHYGIKHIVHIVDGNLCIGSEYVTEIMTVDAEGNIETPFRLPESLQPVRQAIEDDPETFVRLLAMKDDFESSAPVFHFDGSEVVETACENPEWPAVTHDGHLMFLNEFFETPQAAAQSAAKELDARMRTAMDNAVEFERRASEQHQLHQELAGKRIKLLQTHQGVGDVDAP